MPGRTSMRIHGPVGMGGLSVAGSDCPIGPHPHRHAGGKSDRPRTAPATTMRPGRARLAPCFPGVAPSQRDRAHGSSGQGLRLFRRASARPSARLAARRPGATQRRQIRAPNRIRVAETVTSTPCKVPPRPAQNPVEQVFQRLRTWPVGAGRDTAKGVGDKAHLRVALDHRKARHGRSADRRWPPCSRTSGVTIRAATSAARRLPPHLSPWPSAPRCAPGRRHRGRTPSSRLRIRTRS